ncbi:GMC family oxidoreductase [Streptomyces sp. NPDC018026]|uniref:GMC family oxidoreductase n=1 Tax=Streptomyces sp. NPDC018026 TaxID=3365031 RepID=UPI00378D56BF
MLPFISASRPGRGDMGSGQGRMRKTNWDVIVVGAGSAGSVLAARTAAGGKRVLLLEAGRDSRSAELPGSWRSPNPMVGLMDPAASADLLWWDLTSSRTIGRPHLLYARGRGVGGSSVVNGQIAIRPPVEDFEEWTRLGCEGWAWHDVLPYFVRLEDDETFGDLAYHGRGGPTPIHRTPRDAWGAVDRALAESAVAAGFPWQADVNAPGASGVSPYPVNSRDGRRVSVNDGYLEPVRALKNLAVRGDALVDTVVFEGQRAIGVRVIIGGRSVVEYADEVVLSAGAVHSPAVLMRSGIGPAPRLRALGIPVRQDLPVGLGLQDHAIARLSLPLQTDHAIASQHERHTNVCVRWSSASGTHTNDLLVMALNQDVWAMAAGDFGTRAGAFGVVLNKAHSRGSLTLVSTDPTVHPRIDERMLSDERDLSVLREGVRTVAELSDHASVSRLLSRSLREANQPLLDALPGDRALDEYLLTTVADVQHATSTCRMGAPDATDTVVDSSCRVLGTEGLRVVDASVFPAVPRANTNLTTVMVAELMSDRLAD